MLCVVLLAGCQRDLSTLLPESALTTTTTSTTRIATSTSTTPEPTITTNQVVSPTPRPEETHEYFVELLAVEYAIRLLVLDVQSLNAAWDGRTQTGISYNQMETGLQDAVDNAHRISRDLQLIRAPSARGIPQGHGAAISAVEQMADAISGMLEGLRSSDTGQKRNAGLADFVESIRLLGEAIIRIANNIGDDEIIDLATSRATELIGIAFNQ